MTNFDNKEYQRFIDDMNDFFKSNDKTAVIRGVNNDNKLIGTLLSLNSDKSMNTGTIKVNSLKRFKELYFESLDRKLNIKLNEDFNIGTLKVRVLLYSRNDTFTRFNEDFIVFYPVEAVLFSDTETERLKKHIKASHARKNIIIITNDYSNRPDRLSDVIDRQIVLESSKK